MTPKIKLLQKAEVYLNSKDPETFVVTNLSEEKISLTVGEITGKKHQIYSIVIILK